MAFNLQFLRGVIEQFVDKELTTEQLAINHRLFEGLKPAVKDRRDAIFGYIIGIVFGRIKSVFTMMNRQPTLEELDEISKAIKKRFIEIESRINEKFT